MKIETIWSGAGAGGGNSGIVFVCWAHSDSLRRQEGPGQAHGNLLSSQRVPDGLNPIVAVFDVAIAAA